MTLRAEVIHGDCLDVLRTLAPGSVRCCLTSPPYWGLRDYGVPGQLGLEPTPEEYVARMVEVFREVRRVLADDGTLWLNLGDSYAAGGQNSGSTPEALTEKQRSNAGCRYEARKVPPGLKPKNLVGIPWRVAFALQADGWYLRSDIIWSKPNPMPESVQGSHYSRHRVTIQDYEKLSGLRYVDERAGDAWAGDMPLLSEREVSHRQAPLSAESQGHCDRSGEGVPRGRAREAATVQSVAIREAQQSQVRGNAKGEGHAAEGSCEVPGDPEGEAPWCGEAPANEGHPHPSSTAQEGEQQISPDGEGQGAGQAAERAAQGCDFSDEPTTDGSGLAGYREGTQGAVLLLQAEKETDTGSRDPAKQGRTAHESERDSGVRVVQLEETRPLDPALLVGCPGCEKCIKRHGYTFHLSAGRPTKSHEYLFLFSKSASYYYDAAAIAEPVVKGDAGSTFTKGKTATNLMGRQQSAEGRARRTTHGKHSTAAPQSAGRRIVESVATARANGGDHENPFGPTRNARTVWTIATQPYAGAHFATFPEELARRCILAGSAPGDTVLDPFGGSGTVGAVAVKWQRNAVLVELNADYCEMARRRIADAQAQGTLFEAGP